MVEALSRELRGGGDADTLTVPEESELETLREALAGPRTGRELAQDIAETPTLNDGAVGLTIAGPAFEGNPIVAVNDAFERITGYSEEDVVDRNPRFLQGPETEEAAVADLAEAIDIWKCVRVDLRNYRADGTGFENRVGLVPLEDATGTVTNWLGIQEPL
jgi:PAS domain S-box-containing protein